MTSTTVGAARRGPAALDGSGGAQTVHRAIRILLTVAESDEPLSLSEISRRLGFNVSTTYRLLRALAHHGLVARDQDGPSYLAGGRLIAGSRPNTDFAGVPVAKQRCRSEAIHRLVGAGCAQRRRSRRLSSDEAVGCHLLQVSMRDHIIGLRR
jgi:DNA-binding transcriptional ArsR family regulator